MLLQMPKAKRRPSKSTAKTVEEGRATRGRQRAVSPPASSVPAVNELPPSEPEQVLPTVSSAAPPTTQEDVALEVAPTEARLAALETLVREQASRLDVFLFGGQNSGQGEQVSKESDHHLDTTGPAFLQPPPTSEHVSVPPQDPLLRSIVAGAGHAGEDINESLLVLGSLVSPQVRQSIQALKYIHFSALSSDPSPASASLSVTWASAKPTLSIAPPKPLILPIFLPGFPCFLPLPLFIPKHTLVKPQPFSHTEFSYKSYRKREVFYGVLMMMLFVV